MVPPASGGIYRLLATDPSSRARLGEVTTPHGAFATPAFMPVGTVGTVKGVDVERVRQTGAEIILGNTYHLALRPGAERVAELGGLHAFGGWDRPILTDSGGFQVFSLAERVKVTEAGACFASHIDGSQVELSPERSIEIQSLLGSDIAMQFDHVVSLPTGRLAVADAMHRSLRWAERCQAAPRNRGQLLFGIVQGGLDQELRHESAAGLVRLGLDGYAVGGLSVGEPPEQMYATLDFTVPWLPADRPRYLMGVGRPQDLLAGIARGIDMFDCVMPTRNGRNALAFTRFGPLRLRNQRHAADRRPLEPDCPCPACRHSRAYLRHLFTSGEMLGPVLLSIHNLTYYQRLMAGARAAIAAGKFVEYQTKCHTQWESGDSEGAC